MRWPSLFRRCPGTRDRLARCILRSQVRWQGLAQAWQGNIDEYLKMVIQFGYVAFFCCSFPLVPFVAYINNCMECRIDAGKLCYVQQKPDGRNAPDIGIWLHIMQLMTIIAVVVNSALLESLQGGIMAIFPESIL